MPNILMPALSPTMEEGKLSKWLVKEGDTVKSGDVLAEIETDKATMEVESIDEGRVAKLLVAEGTEGVKVNTPIALVLADGEVVGDAEASAPSARPVEVPPVSAEAPVPAAPVAGVPPVAFMEAASDPDLPAGVEMVEMTVRQALNEAMAEELRRD
jgi:pyruvate dehydrogenase E1 component beta subunit